MWRGGVHTWWWIPVLEASRSSRLSVVGYTSCPAHTTEDVQKYADTLDPGQRLYFWLLQTVLYPSTYCYSTWQLAGFGCSFCLAIVQAFRMFVLYCAAFMQALTWQQTSFPTFLGSCHFPKMFPSLNDNDNETIAISWQNVLRWWMALMRKDSWDDSLPLNIITCLLRSFRCYAYSFAALHCFSQSWFISGTPAPAGPVWRSLS